MRKITIISAIILIPVIVFSILQFFYWGPNWKKIMDRCMNYNPEWAGMLDCYGVISIWQPDNSGYLVSNNKYSGSIIAQIREADDFIVSGDQIYLIDISPQGICNNLMPGKYCGEFHVNGAIKTYYYDSPDKVPTYRIFNTQTGDERFYVSLDEIPADDRATFEQLRNK
mgnify:CR=1 FL=1